MNLLNLPIGYMLFNFAAIAVCLLIIFCCICRLDASLPRFWGHVPLVGLMQIVMAAWAVLEMLELLAGRVADLPDALVALSFGLYLLTSYDAYEAARRRNLQEADYADAHVR